MDRDVLDFQEIDRTQVALVGGKGAHLGELSRIEGIRVPPGFCVTTAAFRRIMAERAVDRRSARAAVAPEGGRPRRDPRAERGAPPDDRRDRDPRRSRRSDHACARPTRRAWRVRRPVERDRGGSPTASFAGQQDTYLNVVGPAAILEHVSRCWASLFTERAVTYRLRNGFDHRKVRMAVVVQRMVVPQRPASCSRPTRSRGNRKVAVDRGELRTRRGTGLRTRERRRLQGARRRGRRKTIGKRCERIGSGACASSRRSRSCGSHGSAGASRRIRRPQDIEWCLVDEDFQIVQSRPITTLFPDPRGRRRGEPRLRLRRPSADDDRSDEAARALRVAADDAARRWPKRAAGCSSTSRARWRRRRRAQASSKALGKSDPLIGDALQTILDRGDFIPSLPDDGPGWAPPGGARRAADRNRSRHRRRADRAERGSIAALKRDIRTKSGTGAARLHPRRPRRS